MNLKNLTQLFRSKKRSCLGIDLDQDKIEILEFIEKNDFFEIVNYSHETMPKGAILNYNIQDINLVAETILKALKKTQTKTKNAAIALGGPSVFRKTIELSNLLTEEEIESQIEFDAENYIPHNLEDVNFDFQTIQHTTSAGENNKIALIACLKEMIENYSAAVEMGGLNVHIIDIQDFAIQNACKLIIHQEKELNDEQVIAFLDIKNDTIFLNLHNMGECIYYRELTFGSRDLFEQIKRQYDLENIALLQSKIDSGDINVEEIKETVDKYVSNLKIQLQRALQFYASSSDEESKITHLVFTGAITLLPGFKESLIHFSEYDMRIGNPLLNMKYKSILIKSIAEKKGSELMVATGLAMRVIS